MPTLPDLSNPRRWLLAVLMAVTASAHGAAPQPAPVRQVGAPGESADGAQVVPGNPLSGPAGQRGNAASDPAPDDRAVEPAEACFLGARDGATDAFDCDLAVQVARDPADPPAMVRALVNRALVLVRSGRLEPALADLEAALDGDPDNPTILTNRGNLLLRMGRKEEALAALDRAVELAPTDPIGYYNRAFVYRALGADAEVGADLERVTALLNGETPAPTTRDRAAGPGR